MLKYWVGVILAATLVAAAPIPAGTPSQAPRSEADKPNSTKQNTDANQRAANAARTTTKHSVETEKKTASNTSEKPHNWLEGWNLSDRIAVIASVVAFLQFLALVGTIWVMDRSDKRQLRAYVAVVPSFMVAFDQHSPAAVRFKLVNTGQTPAKRVRHRTRIELLPHPYKAGMSLPAPSGDFSNPMVLFPNTDFSGTKTRENLFTAEEITSIRDQTVRIYVYGELKYSDVFNTERTTLFCSALVADAATLKKITSAYKPTDLKVSFEMAPMGNDAT